MWVIDKVFKMYKNSSVDSGVYTSLACSFSAKRKQTLSFQENLFVSFTQLGKVFTGAVIVE